MSNLPSVIAKLFGEKFGDRVSLTQSDAKKLAQINNINEKKSIIKAPILYNVLVLGAECGFFGNELYLLNRDSYHRYRVTLRIFWSENLEDLEYDKIIDINAGEKLYLFCSRGEKATDTEFVCEVVGESLLG